MRKLRYTIATLLVLLATVHGFPQSSQSETDHRHRPEGDLPPIPPQNVARSNASIKAPQSAISTSVPKQENVVQNALKNVRFQQPVKAEPAAPSRLVGGTHATTAIIPKDSKIISGVRPEKGSKASVPGEASVPKAAPDEASLKASVQQAPSEDVVPEKKPSPTSEKPATIKPSVTERPPVAAKSAQDGEDQPEYTKEVRTEDVGDEPASPPKNLESSPEKNTSKQTSQKPTTAQPPKVSTRLFQSVKPSAAVTKSTEAPPPHLISDQENLGSLGLIPDDGRQSDKASESKNDIYLSGGNVADFTPQQPQWVEPTRPEWRKPPETVDMSPMPTEEDSHFFAYFLAATVLCILAYLAFHNKRKIMALAIEGRAGRQRRNTTAYRRLENVDDHKGRPIF